ncbi:hypothetical protein IGB42_03287 [Andreprevotia sp. IGB-42]|uniref:hypothetical protein n=1 Tax=Andreprevotia sp. IGB-42 TaxID=2497473 RepID=UPI0013567C07|nr:hypothetical protein [Andreprevotia sp. IGB-42]KAF0812297.1 hypothetical protein IGB42_03287 [Andreprevotia sp. IGB-42]
MYRFAKHVASLCLVLFCLPCFAATAPPLPSSDNDVTDSVLQMLGNEQIVELDQFLEQLNVSGSEGKNDDGRWKMNAYATGLEYYFCSEKAWKVYADYLDELKKAKPKSPSVALAEASYWRCYAWDARGSGYSSSVTGPGWKLFKERLKRAEASLNETKSFAAAYPLWYTLQIQNASESNADVAYLAALEKEALERHKYYYQTYIVIARSLTPKWGGSWESLDQFAVASTAGTRQVEGESMYARLYWAVDQQYGTSLDIFKETLIKWPKMKKGFEDLMQRYPKSKRNLNAFASFACRAGDKATFLKLQLQIGTEVVPSAWASNYSMDLCQNIFKGKSV